MASRTPRHWQFWVGPQCTVADVLIGLGVAGVLLAVVFALRSEHGQPPGAVSGGSGTPQDPYRIATCVELQNVGNFPEAAYVLLRDIDCAESAEWNEGAGFFPLGFYDFGFSGSFDGAGHEISHLLIRRPSTDYQGLFGKLNVGSEVRDLTLDGDIQGNESVGGLVGWAVGGTITNVTVHGSVRGRTGVGGVAGVNQALMFNAHSTALVEGTNKWTGGLVGWNYKRAVIDGSSATGPVTGGEFVGGLVGVSHGAAIIKSYASGNVQGDEGVGGLVGYVVGSDDGRSSTVATCYASGDVRGKKDVGDLVGKVDAGGTVMGSFTQQEGGKAVPFVSSLSTANTQ